MFGEYDGVCRIVLNRSFRTACHRLKMPIPSTRPVNYIWLLQQKNLQVRRNNRSGEMRALNLFKDYEE